MGDWMCRKKIYLDGVICDVIYAQCEFILLVDVGMERVVYLQEEHCI